MELPRHPVLQQFTGFLLRKVAMASFTRFSAIAALHGLHPMHYGLLEVIDAEGSASQQAIGKRMGIDPSTMVARMDTLEQLGLIARHRGPEDRRAYIISLTDQGRTTLEALRAAAHEHSEEFFSALTASERKQLHALLAKLAASLDDKP